MKVLSSFASAFFALALSALAGVSVDLGSTATRTPYDSYMSPVRQVLGSVNGSKPTIAQVTKLMRQGNDFRYAYTTPYPAAMPSVTASTRTGDCKAKSLWLIDQLGDRDVRFVVGKAQYGAKLSHAWVLWREASGRWYILDCTNTDRPIAADSVRRTEYIPLYSWSRGGTYRHAATQIGIEAVAGKRSAVAADRR